MINVSKIKNQYKHLSQLVSARRVKDALDVLNTMVGESGYSDFFIQQEHLEHTYEQMLNYMLEGVQDPERDKVYHKLLTSILELADRVKDRLMDNHSGWHTYILKREVDRQQELTGKRVIETMDDLSFKRELDEMIDEGRVSPEADDERRRKLSAEIFRHLWLSNRYNEAENSLSAAIISCRDFLWHEKALYISAILLSGLRYWDEEKVHRLIDFAGEEDQEVSARALVALVILLYKYDNRVEFYPNIIHRLNLISEELKLAQNLEKIALQLIRTRDTLEIGRKLQEDLMPEMAKLKPKLEDKLKRNGATMSASELKKLERDILSRQRKLKNARDEARDELALRQNEERNKLMRKVAEVVKAIGKEKGFDLILTDGVAYSSKKVDISDQVLSRLKKGFKKR